MKYETVKQTLRNEIIDGKYKINEKLPTGWSDFEFSRYTIRRAVGDLENEHYIYRIQGGGHVCARLGNVIGRLPKKVRSLESLVPIWQTTFSINYFGNDSVVTDQVTH